MSNTWRTVRIYVDIRVSGDVREKDLVRGVQSALDRDYHTVEQYTAPDVQFGKKRAKSKSKTDAYEKRSQPKWGDTGEK